MFSVVTNIDYYLLSAVQEVLDDFQINLFVTTTAQIGLNYARKFAYYAFRNFPKIFSIMHKSQPIMLEIMLAYFSYCIIYHKITR